MTRGLPRTLARAASREAGLAPPKLGLKAVTSGQGGAYRTVFTFTGMQVPVADALAYHDRFVGYMAEQAARHQAAQSRSVEATHDELVRDWGPTGSEGFRQKLEVANRAMKKLGLVDAYKQKSILLPDGALTDPQIARAFHAIGEAMFTEDTIDADGAPQGHNPFRRNAVGERNISAISALVKSDPQRARRLARDAGENPDLWMPNNPL